MENDLLSVSRLFFCGMDVYMLYRFLVAIFLEKWKGKKRILFSSVIGLMIFLVNSTGSPVLNLLTVPLLLYLYAVLSFRISLSNGVAYTIIYFSTFGAGKEVSFELLYRLLSKNLPFYIPPWFTAGGIYFLLIEYLVGFLFLLYIEKFIKKIKISNSNSFSWYLLMVPVLSLMISSSFLNIDFPDSLVMQISMCGGAFLLFFTNAMIFIILERYTNVMNKIKYAELYNVKRDMENEHFQNILKVNEHYQHYIHDINAYFNSFRMLAAKGEAKKIIEIVDELKGKIQEEISGMIYSGNPVLNAILSERVSIAKEKRILLSIFVESFLDVDFVSDADMISMFGNLLDNALEAAEKCDVENRKVDVRLFMGSNYFLVLHIENSYAVSAKRVGTRLLSTKADFKHHGLGVGIVMNLADKYGGTLSLEEKADLFVTTLTISTCIEHKDANFGI